MNLDACSTVPAEKERQDERQKLHARSQALVGASHGSTTAGRFEA
jgi:hypothetical protein